MFLFKAKKTWDCGIKSGKKNTENRLENNYIQLRKKIGTWMISIKQGLIHLTNLCHMEKLLNYLSLSQTSPGFNVSAV